jgi:hypothetical protein
MQFADANSLSFVSRGTKKGSQRKRTWMNIMDIGDAKLYSTLSETILGRVRNQVSKFNKLNGKTLSVRKLTGGGFAVIRRA